MLTVLAFTPANPEVILDGLADDLTTMSVVIRLGIAAVLGALIGFERKMADKPADGRTMMLICAGAAAFTLLGLQIAADINPNDAGELGTTRVDPTRVLSYIISGVGFLGAGAILHNKKSVKGLTTAAAVWVAAAIGAACGLAKFDTAIMMFVIVIVALWAPWIFNITRDDDDDDDRRPSLLTALSGNGNGHKNGHGSPPNPPPTPAPASEKHDKPDKGDKPKDGKDGKDGKDKDGKDKDKSGKDGKDRDKPDKDKSDKDRSKPGKND